MLAKIGKSLKVQRIYDEDADTINKKGFFLQLGEDKVIITKQYLEVVQPTPMAYRKANGTVAETEIKVLSCTTAIQQMAADTKKEIESEDAEQLREKEMRIQEKLHDLANLESSQKNQRRMMAYASKAEKNALTSAYAEDSDEDKQEGEMEEDEDLLQEKVGKRQHMMQRQKSLPAHPFARSKGAAVRRNRSKASSTERRNPY